MSHVQTQALEPWIISAPEFLQPFVNTEIAVKIFNELSKKEKESLFTIMAYIRDAQNRSISPATIVVPNVLASENIISFLLSIGFRKVQAITPPHSNYPITLVDL